MCTHVSPATQGFVLSISPTWGVGLAAFMRSRKMIPGSPFSHALFTMVSNSFLADRFLTTCPSLGFLSWNSPSRFTADINSLFKPTEMLKLLSLVRSFFAFTKSSMSGWSTLRIAMLAPRRVPPCLMVSVAVSKTVMKEMGPLETPLVDLTTSFLGLTRENENPVPPPDLWMRAVCLMVSKISSMESSTGRTKQAASCWRSRPAFMRVGEFGMNSRLVMSSKNSRSVAARSAEGSYRPSARAMFTATLRNMASGVSRTTPSASFIR